MFWFFETGMHTKVTKVLEHRVGACLLPFCDGAVERVELATVLTLWFIPLWHFGYREAMVCHKCGFVTSPEKYAAHRDESRALLGAKQPTRVCGKCGSPLAGRLWNFCPYCGGTAQPIPFVKALPAGEEPPLAEATDPAAQPTDGSR